MAKKNGVSNDALIRAMNSSIVRVRKDAAVRAAETSAGFLIEDGEGVQIFVKACRFSAALLKAKPDTGGLYVNVRGRVPGSKYPRKKKED